MLDRANEWKRELGETKSYFPVLFENSLFIRYLRRFDKRPSVFVHLFTFNLFEQVTIHLPSI